MDKNKYKIPVDSGIYIVYVDRMNVYRITTNINEVPNGFAREHKSYEEAKKDIDRRTHKKTD